MENTCIDDRVLIVLDPVTGAFKGAHRDRVYQITDLGTVVAHAQKSGEALTEGVFAALLPDRDALMAQVAALTDERDAAVAARDAAVAAKIVVDVERDAALAQVAALEARIAGTPPADLPGYAAWKRRQVAYGGAVVAPGVVVDSSPEGAAMLTALIESFERGYVSQPVDFRAVTDWVSMDLAVAQAVAAAVAQHVQQCFSLHKALDAAIEAGSITAIAEIDHPTAVGLADWPANA